MRNREERLSWIEHLVEGTASTVQARHNAVIIPTNEGDIAVDFSFVASIVSGLRKEPMALLPPEYCGVIADGMALYPLVEARGQADGPEKALLLHHQDYDFGLLFCGQASVVDLDKTLPLASGNQDPDADACSGEAEGSALRLSAFGSRIVVPDGGTVLLLDVAALGETLAGEAS